MRKYIDNVFKTKLQNRGNNKQVSHLKYIYEIIHICTAVVDEVKSDHRSKFSNFKQLERRSLKKSGLQRDSNP